MYVTVVNAHERACNTCLIRTKLDEKRSAMDVGASDKKEGEKVGKGELERRST